MQEEETDRTIAKGHGAQEERELLAGNSTADVPRE